jgi:mannose-6-phosphate isomerase
MTYEPSESTKVEKPWGHEIHWAVTGNYVGKILFIKTGESLSVQYHREKDETIYIQSGKMVLSVGEDPEKLDRVELTPGTAFHIPPGLIHQMESVEDCTVFEVSTIQLDDVVRLADRYGREGTDQ